MVKSPKRHSTDSKIDPGPIQIWQGLIVSRPVRTNAKPLEQAAHVIQTRQESQA
jgi:hypothetical protein